MPTSDAAKLISFYKRIGFTINDEEAWRACKANIFSIQIGDSKINVHPEGYTAAYRGPTAVPGCTDICFVIPAYYRPPASVQAFNASSSASLVLRSRSMASCSRVRMPSK